MTRRDRETGGAEGPRLWRRGPRVRWLWLSLAVLWPVAAVVYVMQEGEWWWVAVQLVVWVLWILNFVVSSSGTAADSTGLSLGRQHVPWEEVVGFRRQGRDLDVLTACRADGSEIPLTVPGDQLDELLAYAPARLQHAEVLTGSRLAELRKRVDEA